MIFRGTDNEKIGAIPVFFCVIICLRIITEEDH